LYMRERHLANSNNFSLDFYPVYAKKSGSLVFRDLSHDQINKRGGRAKSERRKAILNVNVNLTFTRITLCQTL
jgi:hypothetical protein